MIHVNSTWATIG